MIALQSAPGVRRQSQAPWRYRVAARALSCDERLPELAAYAAAADGRAPEPAGPRALPDGAWSPVHREPALAADGAWSLVYAGPGGIGDRVCEIECRAGPAGYDLAVAGAGRWRIAADGSAVVQTRAEPGADPQLANETLLGPGLVLALALQNVWCLHASAVLVDGGAVLFLGPSGAGKSTLAARLPAVNGFGWQTLGDDLLPAALEADGPMVLPHFPQLKLAADRQPAAGRPERIPLAAIYVLETSGGRQDCAPDVTVERLGGSAAVLALASQTMAGRLFDRGLLTAHLDFCAEVAGRVPVRRLVYRHEYGLLPEVGHAIEHDLRADSSVEGAMKWP